MVTKKPKKPSSAVTSVVGSSGLVHYSGYVSEEFLTALKGSKGVKIFKEMRDNDPVIGAVLFAIDMLLRGVEWRVEGESKSPDDEAAAVYVDECMKDMRVRWSDLISEILTMLTFGWALFEVVYKRRNGVKDDPYASSKYDDGKLGWGSIELRAQETLLNWNIADRGELLGMVQQSAPRYQVVEIPMSKCLLFRTTSHKNNPEGRSVLRNAYRPWYFKKRIEEVEGIGVERDLAGLPVILAPSRIMSSTASSDDQAIFAELKKIVTGIRRDEQEGVIMPSDVDESGKPLYELKLLSTGGSRQFDTDKIVNRYDQRIAMTVLADFILLGHEKVGSFALSSDKTDLFAVALGAWLMSIADVLTDEANKLLSLNGMPGRVRLAHEDIEGPDLVELGDYVTKITGAGVPLFPDPELEGYLKKAANLPSSDESLGRKKRKPIPKKEEEGGDED